jgi:hypothetical protein
MPFTPVPLHLAKVYYTAERKQVSVSCSSFTLINRLFRPILIACLCMGLFQLIAAQPNLPRLWSTTIYGLVILLISVIISLTAQGTSNFFNPHASPHIVRSDLAILKSSLVLLLFANISFLGILGSLHRRYSLLKASDGNANRNIRILAFTLYTAGILVLARNIFCTVQIFSPSDSPAWKIEAFFWVFDASPLLISTLLLNLLHPARLVSMRENGYSCH